MKKEACCKGHPYTPDNTYVDKNGWRQCRVCMRERDRKRYPARRERCLIYLKAWRIKNPTYDLEHRNRTIERHRELLRKHYKENPDRWKIYGRRTYLKRRDKIIAAVKAYRRRNPDMAKRLDILRNTKRKNVQGTFTRYDLIRILKEQNGVCFYCKEPAEKYEVDHKIPIKRGGTNWPDNLCYACFSCNRTKHTMTAEEFIQFRAKQEAS